MQYMLGTKRLWLSQQPHLSMLVTYGAEEACTSQATTFPSRAPRCSISPSLLPRVYVRCSSLSMFQHNTGSRYIAVGADQNIMRSTKHRRIHGAALSTSSEYGLWSFTRVACGHLRNNTRSEWYHERSENYVPHGIPGMSEAVTVFHITHGVSDNYYVSVMNRRRGEGGEALFLIYLCNNNVQK